jgi:hypothetical protein
MGVTFFTNALAAGQGSAVARTNRLAVGRWYQFNGSSTATTDTFAADGWIILSPFWWPGGSIDRLGVNVTTGGSASSVLRFGVYGNAAALGYDYPGALIVDGGTAASTGTGIISASFTGTYIPAGVNWHAVAAQGGAATPPVIATNIVGAPMSSAAAFSPEVRGIGQGGVTGAFPADAPTGLIFLGGVGTHFVVQARVA